MAKKFKSQYKNRPTKPEHEMEEFGSGKKGLILCPKCKAAYFGKAWHHSEVNFKGGEDAPVKFMLCPADAMIKNKQYEGKLVIKNIPKEAAEEIVNLIGNVAESAFAKDPMHRLISLKKVGNDLVGLTTENELAVSMAKKIKNSHKKSKITISYSDEPADIAVAVVEF